jgi:hypothetical protein
MFKLGMFEYHHLENTETYHLKDIQFGYPDYVNFFYYFCRIFSN